MTVNGSEQMNQAVAHYIFWLAFVTPVAWDPDHKCVGSLLQILCGGVLRSRCIVLVYVSSLALPCGYFPLLQRARTGF